MKLLVNKKKCIGCGTCTILAAKTFKMDKDGKSEIVNEKGNSKKVIQNAIDNCPARAISSKE